MILTSSPNVQLAAFKQDAVRSVYSHLIAEEPEKEPGLPMEVFPRSVLDFPSNHNLCFLMMPEGDERNVEEVP